MSNCFDKNCNFLLCEGIKKSLHKCNKLAAFNNFRSIFPQYLLPFTVRWWKTIFIPNYSLYSIFFKFFSWFFSVTVGRWCTQHASARSNSSPRSNIQASEQGTNLQTYSSTSSVDQIFCVSLPLKFLVE